MAVSSSQLSTALGQAGLEASLGRIPQIGMAEEAFSGCFDCTLIPQRGTRVSLNMTRGLGLYLNVEELYMLTLGPKDFSGLTRGCSRADPLAEKRL